MSTESVRGSLKRALKFGEKESLCASRETYKNRIKTPPKNTSRTNNLAQRSSNPRKMIRAKINVWITRLILRYNGETLLTMRGM